MKTSKALLILQAALTSYIEDCSGQGTSETEAIEEAWSVVRDDIQSKEDWAEIHFMVVEKITAIREGIVGSGNRIVQITEDGKGKSQSSGEGAVWELAYEWANEFYAQYKDNNWEEQGIEFMDEFDEFIAGKLK